MRCARLTLLLTLCAAAVLGCSESAPPTAPPGVPNPDFAGADTDRSTGIITVFASGPPNNLAVSVGFEDTELLCTGHRRSLVHHNAGRSS